jgi:cobalt/nickel transport system ATP-binding protein
MIRSMDLRLPRITHLFEILSKNDGILTSKQFPLTIGEARKTIIELVEENNSKGSPASVE